MEHTVHNGTTSTTTTTTINKDQEEWKKKKGFGPLIMLTVLLLGCAFYAGQIRGGTTRGATTAASLTMMAKAKEYHPTCVKSVGTYDSQKDYCYTCGGTSDSGKLGYCWNSQTPQCVPDCGNMKGVSGVGNNQCGDPCDGFLDYQNASNGWLCDDMGYFWYKGSCMTVEEAKNYSF